MKGGYKKYKKKINIKNENTKNKKVIDYGLAILKVIQSFLVLAAHNFNAYSTKNKTVKSIVINRKLHVPTFWIMSFYFTSHSLLSLKLRLISRRFFRLLVPYISWPIIIWNINHFWNKKFKTKLADTYKDLKLQFL